MARPTTTKILEIKAKLVARIRDGFHQPGDSFLSNRALAGKYGVSYQTAHRILNELVEEKWLERRASSGTFIAGVRVPLTEVVLLFHPRAKVPGSFGATLSKRMVRELENARIRYDLRLDDGEFSPREHQFPIMWECPSIVARFSAMKRYGLILHDAPPPGICASYIDSIHTDDISGGVVAAQLLLERFSSNESIAIVAGPMYDKRSKDRIEGFLSVIPGATVIDAGGWFADHGFQIGESVKRYNPKAVFCCNDRLAEGLLSYYNKIGAPVPALVGFDNAPIAEAHHFTTVAIPWDQYVSLAVAVVKKRLAGDTTPAQQVILSLRPYRRLSL